MTAAASLDNPPSTEEFTLSVLYMVKGTIKVRVTDYPGMTPMGITRMFTEQIIEEPEMVTDDDSLTTDVYVIPASL